MKLFLLDFFSVLISKNTVVDWFFRGKDGNARAAITPALLYGTFLSGS